MKTFVPAEAGNGLFLPAEGVPEVARRAIPRRPGIGSNADRPKTAWQSALLPEVFF